MKRPGFGDRLQAIGRMTTARLDRLQDHFPDQSAALPFEEYLARASVRAQRDPAFRAELTHALSQYRLAEGALNGPKK